LYSRAEDVTLGNPFGPFVRGRQAVADAVAAAAGRYRDGKVEGFDFVARHETDNMACVVEVERFRAKVGGGYEVANVSLRVTGVYRREDGEWKLVHRHADPITTRQTAQSVIQR
jgi:ketosteroid isomerase-like protein